MHCRHTDSHLDRCLFKSRRSSGFPSQIKLIREGEGFPLQNKEQSIPAMHLEKQVISRFKVLLSMNQYYYLLYAFIAFPLTGFPEKTLLVSLSSSSNCIVSSCCGHSESSPFLSLHHCEAEALKHRRTIRLPFIYLQRPGWFIFIWLLLKINVGTLDHIQLLFTAMMNFAAVATSSKPRCYSWLNVTKSCWV